jgi:hypothetical protein
VAAGLRDLLALQGVIPLNTVVAASAAGLTVGQASGVWITGGNSTPVIVTAGLTLNQLMGVWVSASANTVIAVDTGGGHDRRFHQSLYDEEEEIILAFAVAFIESRNI